jgi:glycosyltransferase involved in cell wall biosynthesis
MSSDISIVIPCYNHGHFLAEAIASIEAARTPRLLEVIIVDDGSTDPKTHEALDALQRKGYSVIHQKNAGLGAARNAGIRSATGEFILPVDSDNRIRKCYLDQAAQLLSDDAEMGVVYGDAEYFGDKTGRWTVREFDFARLVHANFIDACALMRKRVWEEIGGYDEHMPHMGWEDWDFWLRAALKGWRFVRMNEVAFDYRVRAGSMLSEINKHNEVMDHYLFSKRELVAVGQIRPELHRLWNLEKSLEYRLGKRLLSPVRSLQNPSGGGKRRISE